MTSLECLKEAFAGESQANRRYLAFAKKPMPKVFLKWPGCFEPLLRRKQFTPTPTFAFIVRVYGTLTLQPLPRTWTVSPADWVLAAIPTTRSFVVVLATTEPAVIPS